MTTKQFAARIGQAILVLLVTYTVAFRCHCVDLRLLEERDDVSLFGQVIPRYGCGG